MEFEDGKGNESAGTLAFLLFQENYGNRIGGDSYAWTAIQKAFRAETIFT